MFQSRDFFIFAVSTMGHKTRYRRTSKRILHSIVSFAPGTFIANYHVTAMNPSENSMNSNAWAIVLAGGEGTRVRGFLKQLCGGSGLKQFSTIIGERSMLRCTLDRVERLIPSERILIVVGAHHRQEVEKQLPHWPAQNIIFQPVNRDTAPGILLPLAHITARDPQATIVVFPSDHFVRDEQRFIGAVGMALEDARANPGKLVLLGMTPHAGEETEYGYIRVARTSGNGAALPVTGFVEKPPLSRAKELIQQGALWNTMVFAARNSTLWEMVKETTPVLYHAFRLVQITLRTAHSKPVLQQVYESISSVNFSTAICQPLASRLRVLPVADVGWSDLGTARSIMRTVQELGGFDGVLAQLGRVRVQPATHPLNGFASAAELDRSFLAGARSAKSIS
jgi:mannose-1-phosphate guanylyltransferase